MHVGGSSKVRLSPQEAFYLRNAGFLPADLARLVAAIHLGEEQGLGISVSREIAERFREVFTNRLAAAGFDANYEPTREGELLESLIDRFQM